MPSDSTSKSALVRTLNSLLRSEISATETYTQVIPRVGAGGPADVEVLRQIASEHGHAVQKIRAEVQRIGGTPAETSGPWPAFTKNVEGPARVFVDAFSLTALKEGESRSLEEYREALDRLNPKSATFIRDSLIPAQLKHIESLDEMIERL